MKYSFILLFILLAGILFTSCRSNDKVVLMEERDHIIKTLSEKDSLVVYPRDTLKK